MSVTGFAEAVGGEPTKVGVAITDVVTGLLGAVGILAALREGRGQRIDVSLLESTLAMLINQAQNAFATGEQPDRRGNAHPNIVPYETFATADGQIAVAVATERQWPRLCAALGTPELETDPRFADNGARVRHRDALRPQLAAIFASATLGRLAGRARRRPGAVRPGQRRARGVRLAAGRGARHARRGRAPAAGADAPGRPALQALRNPGLDPQRAAAARRTRRRDPRPSSATPRRKWRSFVERGAVSAPRTLIPRLSLGALLYIVGLLGVALMLVRAQVDPDAWWHLRVARPAWCRAASC